MEVPSQPSLLTAWKAADQPAEEDNCSLGSYRALYENLPAQILAPSPKSSPSPPASPTKQVPLPIPLSLYQVAKASSLKSQGRQQSLDTSFGTAPTTATTVASLDTTCFDPSVVSKADEVQEVAKEASTSAPTKSPVGQPQGNRIRVAARLRPKPTKELFATKRSSFRQPALDDTRAWQVLDHDDEPRLVQKNAVRKTLGRTVFGLDAIYGENDSTKVLYDGFLSNHVEAVLAGQHSSILTYGPTGSGKTFSMLGNGSSPGIVALTAEHLFQQIRQQQIDEASRREYSVTVQFFEIYNETVLDLLAEPSSERKDLTKGKGSPTSARPSLPIAETKDGSVTVKSTVVSVESPMDVIRAMEQGQRLRTTCQTKSNDQSSRSHSIFQISVQSRDRETNKAFSASLNLVDLAGSENSHKSATSGIRKREGGKINQSLLALSRVIHTLSRSSKKQGSFVSYRDSKLTRILQPSLSGRAHTSILCCISNSRAHVEESRNALKFAASAKLASVNPLTNEVKVESSVEENQRDKDLIEQLRRELRETKEELKKLQDTVASSMTSHGALESVPASVGVVQPSLPTSVVEDFSGREIAAAASSPSFALDYQEFCRDLEQQLEGLDCGSAASPFSAALSSLKNVSRSEPSASWVPPVSEVVIMDKYPTFQGQDMVLRLQVAERRTQFLERKLLSNTGLIEKLYKDVSSFRCENKDLMVVRDSLLERIHELERQSTTHRADKKELLMQQMLLKYGLCVGMVLHVGGCSDSSFATNAALWLFLEFVPRNNGN